MSPIPRRTISFVNYFFLLVVKRTGKNAISSTDATIDALCKVFVELENAFHTGVVVQIGIITIRILDKVEYVLDGVEHILSDTEEISARTRRPNFQT